MNNIRRPANEEEEEDVDEETLHTRARERMVLQQPKHAVLHA